MTAANRRNKKYDGRITKSFQVIKQIELELNSFSEDNYC